MLCLFVFCFLLLFRFVFLFFVFLVGLGGGSCSPKFTVSVYVESTDFVLFVRINIHICNCCDRLIVDVSYIDNNHVCDNYTMDIVLRNWFTLAWRYLVRLSSRHLLIIILIIIIGCSLELLNIYLDLRWIFFHVQLQPTIFVLQLMWSLEIQHEYKIEIQTKHKPLQY